MRQGPLALLKFEALAVFSVRFVHPAWALNRSPFGRGGWGEYPTANETVHLAPALREQNARHVNATVVLSKT